MQCKDIPILPILERIKYVKDNHPEYCGASIFPETLGDGTHNRISVRPGFPPNMPEKLLKAKLRKLINSRFITGCLCGCRGDFLLTAKGKATLTEGGS